MTTARKKANPTEGTAELKQTAHRIAAANPEVRALIALLRQRWKRAKPAERRERVADLLGRGCSIRGLADDVDQFESVVRYYSKAAPGSSGKVKPKALQAPIPVKDISKQIAAAAAKEKQGPASARDQAGGTRQQPVPTGNSHSTILPPRPPQATEKALPDDRQAEKEESIESMRLRISQIIVEFIHAKLGSPDRPARSAQILALLGSLRTHSKRQPPWIYPRHLPNRITMSQLYELTGVNFRKEQLNADELGKWLAVLVLSLAPRAHFDPRTSPWEPEIALAERQLVREPEQGDTPPPDLRPELRRSSARFTTTGFADRNSSRVPSRTRGF